ncbi:LysE family transporter [Ectopseudomonas guguanensis]|uniref:LysE family transporter n=1 Tax=Ectopseudomonas guguanensis TaxID=1198456 RepID=UPI0028AB2868|nr:LysE family transporter [Pseudomonas guguanensis]
MFGVTDYAAFVVAFIILLAIPGPGNLALILSTGKGGIRGGLASTFGIIFGDQVLLWLAVAGVAALLKAYPAAFHVVQWLGAAYLIYLGLRMILAKPGAAPTLDIKPRQYLWQTLVITVFNPKAIIFYMAFFSLFIDPQRHQGLITFGFMAVTIMVLTFLYGLLIVLMTHFLAEHMRANPRIARGLEKLAGLCLVGFGVKLTLN